MKLLWTRNQHESPYLNSKLSLFSYYGNMSTKASIFCIGWNKLIDHLGVKEKPPKNADIANVLVNDLIKL